jgi:hypothetical protein
VWLWSTHDQEGRVRSGPLRISVKHKFTFAQEHYADKACVWKSGHCRVGMELRRVHGAVDLEPEALDPGDALNHIQPCGQI